MEEMDNRRLIFQISFLILLTTWLIGCRQPALATGEKIPEIDRSNTQPSPLASLALSPTGVDPFASSREEMVIRQIIRRGVTDPAVLASVRTVPRHLFVPPDLIDQAYNDNPLPIGLGQTISQPYIVALMTEALKLEPGMRVLEIGTGSGYQAAILAEMGMQVYTIEILPELAERASQRLKDLGYTNVQNLTADGYYGWEEYAPFERIIVTAAPDHLPQPLTRQLIEGGRLVIPIGPIGAFQTLWLFEKINGELLATNLGGVSFVPLTGEHE
jgi:protein-L-isoaspartate(D-aspartate) O-methyltransferase